MKTTYEKILVDAWKKSDNLEMSIGEASQICFEHYFENNKRKFNVKGYIENLKRKVDNYNNDYNIRSQADSVLKDLEKISNDEDKLRKLVYDHYINVNKCRSIYKVLSSNGYQKVFEKGVWIYNPYKAKKNNNLSAHCYYEEAYGIIQREISNRLYSNLDVEKIDWNWPSKNYNRALYLRLNILTKRNQFSFIFDVRKYSIGFANLFFDYSFGSRRHEGNYIIEYCDRGFDYTFYSICSEIEKNIKYIESFNR